MKQLLITYIWILSNLAVNGYSIFAGTSKEPPLLDNLNIGDSVHLATSVMDSFKGLVDTI